MIFPDVSSYQQKIDFDKMKSKYVILRAGQRNWIDPFFERNRAECVRVGLNWGTYWLYDDRESPGRQADVFYSVFKDNSRPLEIYMDWELTYGGRFNGLKNVVSCMERIEQLMGMEVGMYTGYYWFLANSSTIANANQYKYLASKSLWLAWYTNDFTPTGIERVKIPPPWKAMTYWQYGTPSIGYEYGVSSKEIDMNYFSGDENKFRERFNLGEIPSNEVKKPSIEASFDGKIVYYHA